MNTEQEQKELLINYLLNNLSEQERDEVENTYFLEDGRLFNLLEIEDQLIRDYVQNRLSRELRNRFETTYLATDAGRWKLDHFLQLQRVQIPARDPAQNRGPATGAGFLSTLSWHFWEQRPLLFPALALLLLAIGGMWILLREKNDAGPLTSRPAAPSAPSGGETEFLVLQAFEETRRSDSAQNDGEKDPSVITSAGTKFLAVKLKLRPPMYAQYRGRLLDRNQHFAEVAHNGQLTPVESPDMRYVLWKLGTDEVPIGDYQVELQGISASGAKGETSHYEFRHRAR